MRLLLSFLIVISMSLPHSSRAAGPEVTGTQKAYAKFVIENFSQSKSLLLVGLAGAGASTETLRIFNAELASAGEAKVEIKKDEVYVDGKPTKIEIAGYSPLSIRYRGQLWSLDKSKSLDANYFALKKFLNPRKSALFSALVGEAQAQVEEKKPDHRTPEGSLNAGLTGGAAFGMSIGMTVALFFAALPLAPFVVAGGVIGAGIGGAGLYYREKAREDREKALIADLMKGQFTLLCDSDSVQLFRIGAQDQSGFRFKHGDLDKTIKVYDANATPLRPELIGEEQKKLLKTFESCKSDTQAAALKAQLQQGAGQVQQALAASSTAPAKTAPASAVR